MVQRVPSKHKFIGSIPIRCFVFCFVVFLVLKPLPFTLAEKKKKKLMLAMRSLFLSVLEEFFLYFLGLY